MTLLAAEVWRAIPGWGRLYQVSDHGRVRCRNTGRVLHQSKNRWGYLTVSLTRDGEWTSMRVHRLVAMAFVPGRRLSAPCVLHIDNCKTNNVPANLKWGTLSQNMKEAWRDGLCHRGEQTSWSKLNDAKVRVIRRAWELGLPTAYVAECFGIDPSSVSAVARRRVWKHVEHPRAQADRDAADARRMEALARLLRER